jgi:hypothetical protein
MRSQATEDTNLLRSFTDLDDPIIQNDINHDIDVVFIWVSSKNLRIRTKCLGN